MTAHHYEGPLGQQQRFGINEDSPSAIGLLAWVPMDFDAPRQVTDYVGNNFALQNAGATIILDPTMGNVVELSAVGEHYHFQRRLVPRGGSSITVAIWIYITHTFDFSSRGYSILADSNSNTGWTWRFGDASSASHFNFEFYIGDGSGYNFSDYVHGMSLNTWYHVATTYDGATFRHYRDGTERFSESSSFTPDWGTEASPNKDIGNDNTLDSKPGRYKDLRVWERALSAQEIFGLWHPDTRWDLYRVDRVRPLVSAPAVDISHVAALADSFDNVVQRRPIKITSY